jgi:hypothetical protein
LENKQDNMLKIGFDMFIWDSRKKKTKDTESISIELNRISLLELSKHVYYSKEGFLEGQPDYFAKYPEDPEPLIEDELIHNPKKLIEYINSPAWSSFVISYLSKLLNWSEVQKADFIVVGVNNITKKNNEIYVIKIDMIKI